MDNNSKVIVVVVFFSLLLVGVLTGQAVTKPVAKASANVKVNVVLPSYYVQGFFVDGTVATSVPGSGTQDGLRCPLYSTVNYHVDVLPKNVKSLPTTLKDFAVLEGGSSGLCSGKRVSTGTPKYIGKVGNNFRYVGTFTIKSDLKKVNYVPCSYSGRKYVHPGNSAGNQIYTCVYPDSPRLRSCWKDATDSSVC